MLVRNCEILQEVELRCRKMTKDPLLYSSQEEIQFGLSGAKRFYGWTDSPICRRSASTGISRHPLLQLSKMTLSGRVTAYCQELHYRTDT